MIDLPDTFEEVEVGDTFKLDDTYEVTESEIIEFAEQWDPQPFHTDPAAAEDTMFEELVASGWHVCAMAMRIMVDCLLSETGSEGAVGVDELRWHEPARPGDILRIEIEVVEKRPWFGPHGVVKCLVEVYASETLVLSYLGQVLWEREVEE